MKPTNLPLEPLLLIRPYPLKNQCRQDYLMSLAEANGLEGIPALSEALKSSFSELVSMDFEDLREYINGANRDSLISLAHKRPMWRESIKQGISSHSRICPECLEAGIAISDETNLPLSIFCSIHKVYLVDTCPNCEKELNFLRRSKYFCNCGCNLTKITAQKYARWIDDFYLIFAPWKQDQSTLTCQIKTREYYAGLLLQKFLVMRYGKSKRNFSPWLRQRNLAQIKHLVEMGPSAFSHELNELFKNISYEDRSDINNKQKIVESPYLSIAISSAQPEFKKHSEDMHSIEGISSKEFKVLRNIFDNSIDVEAAAKKIFCSSEYVLALIKIEMIEAIAFPLKPNSPRIKTTEIVKLIDHLDKAALKNNNANDATTSLINLFDLPTHCSCGVILKSWDFLMKLLKLRFIPLYQTIRSPTCLGLFVSIDDIMKFDSKFGALCLDLRENQFTSRRPCCSATECINH